MNPNLLGAFYSLTAFSLFAGMDVINKFVLQYGSIAFFNFLMYLDGSILIFLLTVGYFLYREMFFKPSNPKFVALRAVISVVNTLASLYAVSHLPLYIFYSLTFLTPFLAVLLAAIFLKERIDSFKLSFLVLGFIGAIFIIYQPTEIHFKGVSIWGLLAAFTVSLTNAGNGILVRKYMPKENTFTIALYSILLSLVLALGYIFFSNTEHFISSNSPQVILIFIAGILAGLGMICSMLSYQKGMVINITHFHYTQMIIGIFFGILLFHEFPSIYAIVGIIIIIISNIMITRRINP